MTGSPFRSAVGSATRRRATAIPRATFVLVAVRERRLAIAAEAVVRVLRRDGLQRDLDTVLAEHADGSHHGTLPSTACSIVWQRRALHVAPLETWLVDRAAPSPGPEHPICDDLAVHASDAPSHVAPRPHTGPHILIVRTDDVYAAILVDIVTEVATIDLVSIALTETVSVSDAPCTSRMVRGTFVRAGHTVHIVDLSERIQASSAAPSRDAGVIASKPCVPRTPGESMEAIVTR